MKLGKHTIHQVLEALRTMEFRRLDHMDYETFAGASHLAMIWYPDDQEILFILDPGVDGVRLTAVEPNQEHEFIWAENVWRLL